MPQMSPMNWILLIIMFTVIFLIMNSNNYFMVKYTPLASIKSSKKMKLTENDNKFILLIWSLN